MVIDCSDEVCLLVRLVRPVHLTRVKRYPTDSTVAGEVDEGLLVQGLKLRRLFFRRHNLYCRFRLLLLLDLIEDRLCCDDFLNDWLGRLLLLGLGHLVSRLVTVRVMENRWRVIIVILNCVRGLSEEPVHLLAVDQDTAAVEPEILRHKVSHFLEKS